MRCPACGWNNPDSYKSCFSCSKPLFHGGEAGAAPGTTQPTPLPSAPPPRPGSHNALPQATTQNQPQATLTGMEVPFGTRFAAFIIDTILLLVIAVPGLLVLMSGVFEPAYGVPLALAGAGIVLFAFLLPALMDSFTKGSIGKRLTKLKVVNSAGGRPNLFASAIRTGVKYTAHFLLPLIFFVIEKVLFGGRSLHELITSTYVVPSTANVSDVQHLYASDTRGRAASSFVTVLAGLVAVVAVLFAALVAYKLMTEPPQVVDPQLDLAIKDMSRITKPVENFYYAQGRFPESAQAAGIENLPLAFSAMTINPNSGLVTLRLSQAVPQYADRTILLYPEFKKRKGSGTVRKWLCGSPDIDKTELPYRCKKTIPTGS
jgi:uncharacterized RDD family membrane protein YckC